MIKLEDVSIKNGDFLLSGISLEIQSGRYAVLAGPTGSGKSTLIEAIVGLRQISSGRILVDGDSVSSLHPGRRNIGYVPQDVCLFPTMSVEDQVGFSLDVRRINSKLRAKLVEELLELLDLINLRNRLPSQLSGGQRQRVAIGRALAFSPSLLCLDEPLSAIDVKQRIKLVSLLQSIHETMSTTVLHITHQRDDLDSIDFDLFEFSDGRITAGQ